jgi:hypothetical protein
MLAILQRKLEFISSFRKPIPLVGPTSLFPFSASHAFATEGTERSIFIAVAGLAGVQALSVLDACRTCDTPCGVGEHYLHTAVLMAVSIHIFTHRITMVHKLNAVPACRVCRSQELWDLLVALKNAIVGVVLVTTDARVSKEVNRRILMILEGNRPANVHKQTAASETIMPHPIRLELRAAAVGHLGPRVVRARHYWGSMDSVALEIHGTVSNCVEVEVDCGCINGRWAAAEGHIRHEVVSAKVHVQPAISGECWRVGVDAADTDAYMSTSLMCGSICEGPAC